jgi:hypothetical protein
VTLAQLQTIDHWVHLLRVADWEPRFKETKRFKGMPLQFGQSDINDTFKEAVVTTRRGLSTENFERTIIHELLHVLFGGTSNFVLDSKVSHEFEQGIETLARLLQRMDHGTADCA